MISKYVANMLTKPGSSPVFGNPRDFNLEYEDVEFKTKDGVKISGWLIKGGKKVVIQSHFGAQASRSGWIPEGKPFPKMWKEKIEFLRAAKKFVDAGYSVLAFDFRNHGNSEEGTSPWIACGIDEAKDIVAAVEFINGRFDNPEIGLVSLCMGANSTVFAFDEGLKKYKNIKAMALIQPNSYIKALERMLPKFFVNRANKINIKRGGKDFNINPHDFEDSINVPTLVVQNTNDPIADMDWVKTLYEKLPVEKEMLWLDLVKQRFAAYDYYAKTPEKIIEWLDKFINVQ